uniref:Uncharacterized protein n=1 Tax=Anguilla anguilla TaxID=7936 RepID=A0A0E9QKA0_ANGAN
MHKPLISDGVWYNGIKCICKQTVSRFLRVHDFTEK